MTGGSRVSSIDRVRRSAGDLGLEIEIMRMEQSTRTADEAAAACGCDVAQIVKSLIFENESDDSLVLCLVSGSQNLNISHISKHYELHLRRCDTRRVRKETGFAIGCVAPIGHTNPISTYMDSSLLEFESVWAAAGRPDSIFRVDPKALAKAVDATTINVTESG